ncbi:tissue factor pathway inhibitor-like isoform X2 [Sinocyclocheilus rhinocerous]|uniref:Tissue factor pathway inhibitor-like n=1 Tax=Sinocyclocheilus rhinocerous TaxID=307959 RepID=A0A673H7E4_9TELE|nr:PREDICTED: tissue factor pathway inhibitor-like isoform X2 [Sinocyclocheilus rhinocerous]
MAQVCFTASLVGLLCCLSVLNACTWDPDTDTELEQGLDISSFDNGAAYLAHLPELTDAEQCQSACCERDDCQLAVIGTPADDGRPECILVSCMKDGKDVCVLTQSTQFKVYRKILDSADQEPRLQGEVRSVNSTDHCRLPSVVGICRAAFPRFYYDVTDQTCKQFIYGGCGGNDNNFNSQEECEASCSGVTDVEPLPEMTSAEFKAKCLAPAQTGLCRASIRRYYYNDGICQPFTFGGCGGNENNYKTEESCMTTCTVKVIPSNKKGPVDPNSPKSFEETCAAPSDSGPCRAAFQKFYFEPSTQSCKRFIYGGCQGNLNRYSSEEECMAACSGKDGRFDGHTRSRWTPAFFLVATLAIMSALLLVGLILIAVRRNSHRSLFILDDKEELLPTEEQVSYEKLPKEVSS